MAFACLGAGVLPVQVRSHIPKFAHAVAVKKLHSRQRPNPIAIHDLQIRS